MSSRSGQAGHGTIRYVVEHHEPGRSVVIFDLANGLASDYDRVDLAVYSPLCLLLGRGALIVARDLPSRRSSTPARHGANLTTSRPPRSSTLTSPAPCRTLR